MPKARRPQQSKRVRAATPAKPAKKLRAKPDGLAQLRSFRRRRDSLDAQAARAVDELRAAGVSWERIGGAYGITGAGARRRWAYGLGGGHGGPVAEGPRTP